MADIVSFADCFAGCTPADAFGAVSSALQIAFYASPLPAMANAVRVGSSERIHAPFATAWLLNSSLWVTYGLWVHDWHIIVPQVLGVLVAAAQLGLVVTLGSAQRARKERSDSASLVMFCCRRPCCSCTFTFNACL